MPVRAHNRRMRAVLDECDRLAETPSGRAALALVEAAAEPPCGR
jgi:hypothetical protein